MTEQENPVQTDPLKQNPQSSDETSGPKFGLDPQNGRGQGFRGWINKYGSSVILPIIALLILAGGIYLYTSQQEEDISLLEDASNTTPEQTIDQEQPPIEEIIPASRIESENIIEKTAPGEGITHLARRALKNHLEGRPQELTNEHKVFVEDYLKDKIGSKSLEVGEEIAFSQNLIEEAIDASSNLSPEELKVLEEYSTLINWG